jgi:hypothetical protein
VPHATAIITTEQRDAIYDLLLGRLTFLPDLLKAVEQEDFETARRLAREFTEDFRLLEDLGWGPDERPEVSLTIPAGNLPPILERLRSEAQGGLSESAEERDSREAEEASRRRWRIVVGTASELLAELQGRGGERA